MPFREDDMFYPVKIFSRKGKFRKEVSSKLLSRQYWDKFYNSANKNIQISNRKGKNLKAQFPDMEYDDSFYSED